MFYIGTNVMQLPLEAQRAPADGKLISLPIALRITQMVRT